MSSIHALGNAYGLNAKKLYQNDRLGKSHQTEGQKTEEKKTEQHCGNDAAQGKPLTGPLAEIDARDARRMAFGRGILIINCLNIWPPDPRDMKCNKEKEGDDKLKNRKMGLDPLPSPYPDPDKHRMNDSEGSSCEGKGKGKGHEAPPNEKIGIAPLPSPYPDPDKHLKNHQSGKHPGNPQEKIGLIPVPEGKPSPRDKNKGNGNDRIGIIPLPSPMPNPGDKNAMLGIIVVCHTQKPGNPFNGKFDEKNKGNGNDRIGIIPLPSPMPNPGEKNGHGGIILQNTKKLGRPGESQGIILQNTQKPGEKNGHGGIILQNTDKTGNPFGNHQGNPHEKIGLLPTPSGKPAPIDKQKKLGIEPDPMPMMGNLGDKNAKLGIIVVCDEAKPGNNGKHYGWNKK